MSRKEGEGGKGRIRGKKGIRG
jgi:hypothetical protein